MRLTCPLLFVAFFLLLLPSTEAKKQGKGRGLKGARHKLSRVRGAGRHSRSDTSRLVAPNCAESTESGEVFIDCQERHLNTIPSSQAWSKEPKHLLLARNRIKVLRNRIFTGYEALTSLDLQQNEISLVEEGAFQGLTRLTTLLLQHNRVSTLSEETLIPMPNLRYMRLYDNPWNCQCFMDSLIRMLQVPSNRNLGNHAKCEEPVWLKGQKLKQLEADQLCKELPSSDQGARPSTSPLLPSGIRTKPDATAVCHTYLFPQVRMDCRNKGLTEVPAGIPDDVVQLDLSHNSIRHLKAKEFQGVKNLKFLNLSSNNMEHLDTASLTGLLHLRELDLSNNLLHFVQYGVLEDLYFLSQLKLGGNPWVCDYSIHYMVYWLRLHPAVKYSGLLCRSPPDYTGERVEEYVNNYNRGCPKERPYNRPNTDQTDPEVWNTPMELQAELEEELEPSHLRVPQKYEIFRLS
ncbi:leucine-rich repeat-containing protein 17-like [Eucyclogobius newberryi]|uniref:leucine-rich repeat-containing protein 17-like n=1 Tax=Eucyclogobius newberryi TaxID=166745 RepID=UPI003B5C6FC5